MRRKSIFFRSLALSFLLTMILGIAGTIYAQEVWSLEDCINYALDNNIQIKQSELNAESYEDDWQQSKLALLPSLNASASHSYGWGRSIDLATYEYTDKQTQQNYFSASSEVNLFNGLQKFNLIKRDLYNYMASKYDSDKMRDDISLQIAAAYLQILFSKEMVQQAKEQVAVTKLQIERTQKLVDAGTLPRGDLLDIQSQGATEELNLINAQNQLNLAYLDLLQLLDKSMAEKFEIETPKFNIEQEVDLIESEKIYGMAVTHLPEIKSAEYQLMSSERELARARGMRSPTLNLRGTWGTNYSDQIVFSDPSDPDFGEVIPFGTQLDQNQNKTLSLSLSIPIFNGYQVSTYINQSKLNRLNAQYNLELQKNVVRKSVEQAYTDALAAFKAYKATEKSLSAYQEAFKYMEQKFNVGMVNSLDYNVAKSQLTRAESELLSAKYDFIFKSKVLDFYMGIPITLGEMTR